MGDAVVLGLQLGTFELRDCHKQVRIARQLLVPRIVIKDGHLYARPEPCQVQFPFIRDETTGLMSGGKTNVI